MPNYKLTFEYDGSEFAGWQRQAAPNRARTVQEEIERAMHSVFQEEVDVVGSGRTDAGVHARGQVAHAILQRTDIPAEEMLRVLRAVLPHDVVCLKSESVDEKFHARYDAVRRNYSYAIAFQPLAIGRMYAWHVGTTLDVETMDECAAAVLGDHDFTAYSKENAEVKNRRCVVVRSEWVRSGQGLRYEISADRFVYSMIRALVGAMIAVGRGRISVEEFCAVLHAHDRARNKNPLAPPHGLCLESVEY